MGGANTAGGIGYTPSIFATTGRSLMKQIDSSYNPSVTNASSDFMKLPRVRNDPVIDNLFMKKYGDSVDHFYNME